jgi:integrase
MVDAVQPFVSPQVWAIIQLQRLTGARAGELVILRPADVDTSGEVWLYTPTDHKTAHHGHERTVYLGPKAQEVLQPFLLRNPEDYCFSPAEAEAAHRREKHARRNTPLSCGNRPGSNRTPDPKRKPGDHYTTGSYRRAITRACEKAFPPPAPLARQKGETHRAYQARLTDSQKAELKQWRKEHHWHPHQLRHNAATDLRKQFGVEAARLVLGHRSAAVTEIYAEVDKARALEVIAEVG